MPYKEIKFNDPKYNNISFLGRTGTFRAIGLILDVIPNDRITLTPINSRDAAARCRIEIPLDSLADVIKTLQDFHANFVKPTPDETSICDCSKHARYLYSKKSETPAYIELQEQEQFCTEDDLTNYEDRIQKELNLKVCSQCGEDYEPEYN